MDICGLTQTKMLHHFSMETTFKLEFIAAKTKYEKLRLCETEGVVNVNTKGLTANLEKV